MSQVLASSHDGEKLTLCEFSGRTKRLQKIKMMDDESGNY